LASNIRELRNTIERALVVVGEKDQIEPDDLILFLSKTDLQEILWKR